MMYRLLLIAFLSRIYERYEVGHESYELFNDLYYDMELYEPQIFNKINLYNSVLLIYTITYSYHVGKRRFKNIAL